MRPAPRPAIAVARLFVASATLLATAALLAAAPTLAFAWGGQTHTYIAQHYSQHLPPAIDGLRAYDSVVISKVNDPDTRKSSTPGEAPRHFIDIDTYPEFAAGTLSHDRATLDAEYGATFVTNTGIVPWAVGEVVTTLTQQFAAQQWSSAATTIADLCHYVGDSTQPLHCTKNYDGQLTGNNGVHSRYETTMMGQHLGELTTPPASVTYYPNVVDAMFSIIDDSWDDVAPLLAADNTAKTASGGSFNSTYYTSLWNSTQTFTRSRVNIATLATASMVYTAWKNAGEPVVPGSSASVPPTSIGATSLETWPLPARTQLSIRFTGAGPFTVDVFDVRGRRVARVVDSAPAEGTISWRPPEQLGAGVYFLRMATPKQNLVRRVVLLD